MLQLKNVSKIYTNGGRRTKAIQDFTLSAKEGEFITLVGPSGCGKSTLLKIIAGLSEASRGTILLEGKKVEGPSRDRGMVFQGFTLFPWLTVRENISFGLDLQKKDQQKTKIVDHYLEITGLRNFADFYPKNLSGGMQQRVAIARTLANNPKILLMDEPFGSLDTQTRSQMQELLIKLWEKERKTILFVTHDVREALFLADKIYVLEKRPMKIKRVFNVPFSRPRTHSLKCSKEFFELEKRIEHEFETELQIAE